MRFLPGFFRGGISHLNGPGQLRQFAVFEGAVPWPDELDLAPDATHEEIKQRGGKWVVEK